MAEATKEKLIEQGADYPITLRHVIQGSLAEARNEAVLVAREEWLIFLDADDSLAPDYVEVMERTRRHHAELYVPAIQPVVNGQCVGDPAIPAWDASIYDINCACIGTMVNRELFLDAEGFGNWPIYEDWELVLRLIANGAKLYPVPEAVYCANMRAGSRNAPGQDSALTYRQIRDRYRKVPASTWAGAKLSTA